MAQSAQQRILMMIVRAKKGIFLPINQSNSKSHSLAS